MILPQTNVNNTSFTQSSAATAKNAHKERMDKGGPEAAEYGGLITLPSTILQHADAFTKIKLSRARSCCLDLSGPRVIHIPLDRMDTPVPCQLCKNHFPTEVRLASTDTLTCLGLTPPY